MENSNYHDLIAHFGLKFAIPNDPERALGDILQQKGRTCVNLDDKPIDGNGATIKARGIGYELCDDRVSVSLWATRALAVGWKRRDAGKKYCAQTLEHQLVLTFRLTSNAWIMSAAARLPLAKERSASS